ncbi:MAG: hypothetical protein QOC96_3717 [Acidobacteriota bacterium]|jgi:hypothetical protein|nr:hypothetical protein [Acidobacteriota bacterium]
MRSALSLHQRSIRHCLFVLLFFSLLFTIFFSPVLFHNSLLAPADGLLYHLAYFQSKKVFWDTLLSSGFPMTADPQVMAWYPPSLLLSLFPGLWNVFVVSAYVMASCFTYGYVYALTQSRLASLVSGITYGMCGFMMAQLGHTAIIHVAAWPPLIIWSLEMLRRKFSAGWLAIGCFAVACCVLAGHLQIVVYGLLLSACYAAALGWRAPIGRGRYYLISALLLLLGLGLAALQILPTLELAKLSARAEYTFADFVSYSLPLKQIVLLLFPAVFGGLRQYGTTPYFGAWNLTELTGYVGLLPLLLAAVGFIVSRRKAVSIFWLCVCVLALLLALGDQTPLAYLTYYLPVLGKFRVPARHLMEMSLAVSVLAGIGVQAILRGMVTRRVLFKTLAAAVLVMCAGLLFLITQHQTEYALATGGTVRLNARPWSNPAIATPLIIFLVACSLLFYWHRNPTSALRKTLLVSLLLIDVASFGWFYDWRTSAPRKDILRPPVVVAHYQNSLRTTNQRVLPVRGTLGTASELPPNLSRLWEIPSASVYGPLSLSRVNYLLSLRADASVDPAWKNADDQSLNLAAVRYVFLPRADAVRDERGVSWSQENMDARLGSGCNQPSNSPAHLDLPSPVRATSIGIVSRLACSVSVPDDAEIARVLVTGADGSVQVQSLRAGRETAEWAYDSASIKPQMKHRRAVVFSNLDAKMGDESYSAHNYVARLTLNGVEDVRRIEFQWTGQAGELTIEKLTLINEPSQTSEPVDPLLMNSGRWRLAEEAGNTLIYENLQAMPRAWLAPEAVNLTAEEILQTIKTSRLPDGRAYDPSRTALVEEPISLTGQNADPATTSAQVVRLTDTTMEVQTTSSAPALLVTSDTFYPGWRAFLDGTEVRLFRADYALRGVPVPAGSHLVRFSFRPKSFTYGAAVSAFSLLILAGFLLIPLVARQRSKRELLS